MDYHGNMVDFALLQITPKCTYMYIGALYSNVLATGVILTPNRQ